MNKIIALNHKMNLNYDLVSEYIEKINKVKTDNKIIIIPSYLYISTFIKNTKYDIGSQNLSNELNGAFTGEVSSTQLNSIGVLAKQYARQALLAFSFFKYVNDNALKQRFIFLLTTIFSLNLQQY